MAKRKKTSGDVIKINVLPPSTAFPWVRVFKYPYGLRAKKSRSIAEIGAMKNEKRKKVALKIGEAVINGSKILSKWFR